MNTVHRPLFATNHGRQWTIYRDIVLIFVVFLAAFYAVYFSTATFSRIFFLGLIFLFMMSADDYFWFAFFFVIAQGPAYIFADFRGTSLHRLPLYTFSSGMSLTPIDLFVFFALLKALIKGRRVRLRLANPLLMLLIVSIALLSLAAIVYGAELDIIAWNVRWFFYYSIIISFSYLVVGRDEVYRFVTLVLPFVFVILFDQIYTISTGNEFVNLFSPGARWLLMNSVTGALRPVMGGVLLVLFCFAFALLLSSVPNFQLPKALLYTVMAAAFLSVFLSATRLWFLTFSFILVGYMVLAWRKISSILGIIAIFIIFLGTLLYFDLIPKDVLTGGSWARLNQVYGVVRGDIYSIDTARFRIVNQLPLILQAIKENPLVGYGFSRATKLNYNDDFGFLNTILIFGCIGFSFLLYLFARLFAVLISSVKNISGDSSSKLILKLFIIVWVSILIGYFATWDYFSYYSHKVFFVSILFALTEFFVREVHRDKFNAAHGY